MVFPYICLYRLISQQEIRHQSVKFIVLSDALMCKKVDICKVSHESSYNFLQMFIGTGKTPVFSMAFSVSAYIL